MTTRITKLKHTPNPKHAIFCESIEEYLNIEASEVNKGTLQHGLRPHGEGSNWFGVEGGVDGVNKAIREGWPEGVKMANEIKEELGNVELPSAPCIKRKRRRGDFGEEVDMQKVYSGQLDTAWTQIQKADTYGNPIITIRSQTNGSCMCPCGYHRAEKDPGRD